MLRHIENVNLFEFFLKILMKPFFFYTITREMLEPALYFLLDYLDRAPSPTSTWKWINMAPHIHVFSGGIGGGHPGGHVRVSCEDTVGQVVGDGQTEAGGRQVSGTGCSL